MSRPDPPAGYIWLTEDGVSDTELEKKYPELYRVVREASKKVSREHPPHQVMHHLNKTLDAGLTYDEEGNRVPLEVEDIVRIR